MSAGEHSRVALATTNFAAMADFYRGALGLGVVEEWSREHARGLVLQAPGLRIELLDALRDSHQFGLHPVGDRVHLVIDVADAAASFAALAASVREHAAPPAPTSWCAAAFKVRDPDGVAVWFVQRT